MASDTHIQERRDAILRAARSCFAASGYARTTMDAVADQAGISKGSIYNYFKSKQDLFRALFTAAIADEIGDWDRLGEPGASPREKLLILLDRWSQRQEYYSQIGRIMLEFWAAAAREDTQGEFSAWFSEMYESMREKLVQLVAEGIESGAFRREYDPRIAATLIMACLDGIQVQHILDTRMNFNADTLAALKNAIIASLTAEPTTEIR